MGDVVCEELEDLVHFSVHDLPARGYVVMEEIRRQGKLCDVTLKVCEAVVAQGWGKRRTAKANLRKLTANQRLTAKTAPAARRLRFIRHFISRTFIDDACLVVHQRVRGLVSSRCLSHVIVYQVYGVCVTSSSVRFYCVFTGG